MAGEAFRPGDSTQTINQRSRLRADMSDARSLVCAETTTATPPW